jgi:hypothetical protein
VTKPRIGSIEHRDLFCKTFHDTHKPFEPDQLAWPVLEPKHIELLRAFPFWSLARSMEQEADRMIAIYAKSVTDPVIREAVALQGYEEGRHGRLINYMLEHYHIVVPAVPLSNMPIERDDFVTFGFGECTDSFIGFGGFALARAKQVFPKGLLDIFEQLLFEEARHITFFINWWRYEEELAGNRNPLARTIASLKYQAKAVMHTAQGAQGAQITTAPMDLTGGASQVILDGVTPLGFLEIALAEERMMMSRIDKRLLKPRIVPFLATLAVLALRMLPPRKDTVVSKPSLSIAS